MREHSQTDRKITVCMECFLDLIHVAPQGKKWRIAIIRLNSLSVTYLFTAFFLAAIITSAYMRKSLSYAAITLLILNAIKLIHCTHYTIKTYASKQQR